ncbi:unnamed protein product [Zymoseptoria tritici ST99CH_3D1]|uniref:Uncharacterized protein n=1 Tax=Zymoseptoria tritici ST99CH_1E4 TaxID=1276532 RepID=A0A2H1G3P0_ZYMTR|nr:unnamed protein product [Zymoseptoria tritici ST99CH_1E4]SMR49387.1 unnamed protein product [Zymoseptoria tritici ST99CH_3D1]
MPQPSAAPSSLPPLSDRPTSSKTCQVQKFAMPKAPASPEEADLQNDLSAYEQQVPEVEGQAAEGSSAPVEDWFVEEVEEEAAHH